MNDEQRALLEKARRALRSARLVLEDDDPATAASRAYYAMFYRAEALLLDKELSVSTHKGVITAFGEHFVKEGPLPEEVHDRLRQAFDKRLVADYEVEAALDPEEVEEMLGWAGDLVDRAQLLLDA